MGYTLIKLNKGIDIVNGILIRSSSNTNAIFNNGELIGLTLKKDNGIKLISDLADNKKELKRAVSEKGSKEVILNLMPRYEEIEDKDLILTMINICNISHYGLNKVHRLYIDQYGEYWYEIIDSLMRTSEILKYEDMINKLEREVMAVV